MIFSPEEIQQIVSSPFFENKVDERAKEMIKQDKELMPLNRKQLAEVLGLSLSTVSKWKESDARKNGYKQFRRGYRVIYEKIR